jgi:hypothetical protein
MMIRVLTIPAALSLMPLLWGADRLSKTVVVTAQAASGDQQLWLHGVKSPGARGIRVYVNPSSTLDVQPDDQSRVGTLFFSDGADGKGQGETFVLSLPSPVTGQARILIVPIPAKEDHARGRVQVESAEIKAAPGEHK